ncbi:MAG: hypothetical protein ACLFQA_00370 [Bacteroidales bacterium]
MRLSAWKIMQSMTSSTPKEPEGLWKFGWEKKEPTIIDEEQCKAHNIKNMINILK